MDYKSTQIIRGNGTPASPQLLVNMPRQVYESVTDARAEANYKQVEDVARANGFTHAIIAHWNHHRQLVHDATGRRARRRNPASGAWESQMVAADEHITCSFRDASKPFELVRAHVYVVAGPEWIPVGLMKQSARRFTGPGDVQSPQFWKHDLRRRLPREKEDESARPEEDPLSKGSQSGADDANTYQVPEAPMHVSVPEAEPEAEPEAWPENIDVWHYDDPMELLPFEVQQWLKQRIEGASRIAVPDGRASIR